MNSSTPQQPTLEQLIKENLWGYCCPECKGGGGMGGQDNFTECSNCKGTGIVDWQIEPLKQLIEKRVSEALKTREDEIEKDFDYVFGEREKILLTREQIQKILHSSQGNNA